MSFFWQTYDEGRTIGTIGSEEGTIITDIENTFGARVTVEEEGPVAPASITIGIYGLLFHTAYFNSLNEANSKSDLFKDRIEEVIAHYLIGEDQRGESWKIKHNTLMDSLVAPL